MIHLTKVTAAELSPANIRVNAICPGLIATSIFGASMGLPREVADQMAAQIEEVAPQFQPTPKAGLPRDIAEAALYLASDASAFVTGTHLVVGRRHHHRPRAIRGTRRRSRPCSTPSASPPSRPEAMQAARKAAQNDG